MKKPNYPVAWKNKLKSVLENFKSKEDFKKLFKEELVKGKDPYNFWSPRGDDYMGEGTGCLFDFLKEQRDKKSLEKLDIFLEAIVESTIDEKIFNIPLKSSLNTPSGFVLYGITNPVPKKEYLAKKVLPLIKIEDIITGKINEKSDNYLHQECLVGLYFDLLPAEKYDFELIDKLGNNLSFSALLFYTVLKVNKSKSKNLAKNYAKYETNKGLKEMAEWVISKYYPGDKEMSEFLRGLK